MLEIIKDYKRVIIIGIVLILAIIFLFCYKNNDNESVEIKEEITTDNIVHENVNKEPEVRFVIVDVKGAVKKPGIYSLKEGSIVNDAIKEAGLKSNATTKNINLSKKISNEMVIYVYTSKELEKNNSTIENVCSCNDVNISSCDGSSVIVTSGGNKAESDQTNKININVATKDELMTLSGIGESKAIAIIQYRDENNGFNDIAELMNVSGIGEALYNKVKDFITI